LSNKIIPKEQLSAYQRWEMSVLDEPAAMAVEGQIPLPTAEEIEHIQQQAHDEGFAAGLVEGRRKGSTDAENLKQLLAGVEQAVRRADEVFADEVVGLALEVAKQMLRHALKIKPEMVVNVVRDAMGALPQSNHHLKLVLHPEDASLVRAYLEADLAHSSYKVAEDSRIERGGCRIENTNSELDATMETRWKMIVAALGRDDSWLE
jgi:flagellar assembly protein FliH